MDFNLLKKSVLLFSCDTLPDRDPSLVGSAAVAVVAVRKGFAAVVQSDWSWLVQAGWEKNTVARLDDTVLL